MPDSACDKCQRPLTRIDFYGELLEGCICHRDAMLMTQAEGKSLSPAKRQRIRELALIRFRFPPAPKVRRLSKAELRHNLAEIRKVR
jgi:hypothetical protein